MSKPFASVPVLYLEQANIKLISSPMLMKRVNEYISKVGRDFLREEDIMGQLFKNYKISD